MTVVESRFSASSGSAASNASGASEREAARAATGARRGRRGRVRRATATRSGSRRPRCRRARSGARRRAPRREPRRPPATAIAAPVLGARWRTAYQTPIAATARPTCSFVAIAAAARSANAHSRPSSRCHHANRSSGHASATGWKSLTVSHCTGGESEIGEGERSGRPTRRRSACGRARRPGALRKRPRPPGRRAAARDRARPTRAEREGQDRVEVRAETGDLLAVDVGDREEVAVGGRPDRLGHVSEVEAAAVEARCRRTASRAEDSREGGGCEPDDRRARLHLATSCSTRPSQRAPRTASLACSR